MLCSKTKRNCTGNHDGTTAVGAPPLSPAAGWARIAGLDVGTQLASVHRVLGCCPQFDCLWDDLTVREHLLFYARLKGVSGAMLSAAAQQTAQKIDLDGDALNMNASLLSGGQRRRLSLGIALIGT